MTLTLANVGLDRKMSPGQFRRYASDDFDRLEDDPHLDEWLPDVDPSGTAREGLWRCASGKVTSPEGMCDVRVLRKRCALVVAGRPRVGAGVHVLRTQGRAYACARVTWRPTSRPRRGRRKAPFLVPESANGYRPVCRVKRRTRIVPANRTYADERT